MSRFFVVLFSILIVGCLAPEESRTTVDVEPSVVLTIPGPLPVPAEIPFGIELQIKKIDNTPYLVAEIQLRPTDYIISPLSKDGIYGNVTYSINDQNALSLGSEILESPESIVEFDSIIQKPVRFVRETTKFKQSLQINTTDTFQAQGKVWFVLEPLCIPYQADFVITQSKGQFSVAQTSVGIDRISFKGR